MNSLNLRQKDLTLFHHSILIKSNSPTYSTLEYLAIVLLGDIEANKAVPVLLDNLEYKNIYVVYSGSYTDPERLYPSAIALTKIGTPVIEPTIKKLSKFNKNEAGHKICCWILKEILGAKLAKASVQIAIDETLNVIEKQNLNDAISIINTYVEEEATTFKPLYD